MSDRELLEAAAKAAGMGSIALWGTDADGKLVANFFLDSDLISWNPLEDDGDALRLAVKVRLHLYDTNITNMMGAGRPGPFNHSYEPRAPDPYAATRRAIVRAAAAIGAQHGD